MSVEMQKIIEEGVKQDTPRAYLFARLTALVAFLLLVALLADAFFVLPALFDGRIHMTPVWLVLGGLVLAWLAFITRVQSGIWQRRMNG